MTVQIHTDGSCHGNPGPGGWAAIILTDDGQNRTIKGRKAFTTNNEMELTAAIMGLRALEEMSWTQGLPVVVHTDSKYVSDAFLQGWIANWQRNGWRTAKKQPVANRELWEQLIPLVAEHSVIWQWVKGHSGDYWNELCDQVANEQADIAGQDIPMLAGDMTLASEAETRDQEPRTYDQGWRDGYEAAQKELMELIQSMENQG